jgi:hypothetical protein
MGTRDRRRWRRIQIRFHRPARRLHRLKHVGRHVVTWRRIIVGRRIRRRRTGQWAVGPRRIGRRRTRQRTDRRIVGPTAKRRRRCHHADNAIGGRPRHDAIDGADRARARIDHDAHENAAIIGGADHIGRAFPARSRQRIVAGRAHDPGDLVRRYETGQWSPGGRRRSRRRRRLRVADRNGRNHKAQRQRGSTENPCPHGPNPLAPARSNESHIAMRLCAIGAALGRPVKKFTGRAITRVSHRAATPSRTDQSRRFDIAFDPTNRSHWRRRQRGQARTRAAVTPSRPEESNPVRERIPRLRYPLVARRAAIGCVQ